MLDKNPNQIIDNNFKLIQEQFSKKNPNVILCSHPFLKTEFLNKLIQSSNLPVIFVDFDLMYSGYVNSNMIENNDNVEIFHPEKSNWEEILSEIIKKSSKKKYFIIFDSLNGIYNIFDKLESTRFVNACIMLLASCCKNVGSSVLVTAFTRKNDENEWILSPGGRHVISSKDSGMYYLKQTENNLSLITLTQSTESKIFKIKH